MKNEIDLKTRSLGINFNNETAEVKVWSPLSNAVSIKCDHNIFKLHKDDFGFWHGSFTEINRGDYYKIVLNDSDEFPDPASLSQPDGVHGKSAAIDIKSFKWTDNNWKNIPLKNYILYELHTGTFSAEGNFKGIEEKLDYLVSLGITAIEIMPVAQFPGTRNWGYDGVFPFAVQHNYGGAEGLQYLVNACHLKGIAVILDVVYNHLGPEGNYLGAVGPYFTNKYKTPWGNAINFDDEHSTGVRQYFIENALMWFRDFHIDALRLDAVHAIKDSSSVHLLQEMKMHVDELMKYTGNQHYLIVEFDLNEPQYINPIDKGGYGMDAQWIDEFHHALRVAAGGGRNGYYEDFKGINDLAKSYQDAYVYDGQYSAHRKRNFGTKAEHNSGQQFIVFSQNHDQIGNRMLGERTSVLTSFDMQKLMAAAVLASPYLPMLFMGEEFGEENPFLYFVSHTDPALAEAVRRGRKEEFASFHLDGEAPDPMAIKTFEQSKLQWHLIEQSNHQVLYNYYKAFIQLRKKIPALNSLERKQISVSSNEEMNTLMLHRWHNDQHVICFMNFSDKLQTLQIPAHVKQWHKIIASGDRQWLGKTDTADSVNANENIELQPESFIMFCNHSIQAINNS